MVQQSIGKVNISRFEYDILKNASVSVFSFLFLSRNNNQ